jgi:hypothetical protein
MNHSRNKFVAGTAGMEMELDSTALRLAEGPLNIVR